MAIRCNQGVHGMNEITFAATQMACVEDRDSNIGQAEAQVREAAGRGAQVILLQELFESPYFCKDMDSRYFGLAHDGADNPLVRHFQSLARELEVVLPISFFERANNAHFNSISIIDADGAVLGTYRKSHIPDSPGYQEKFYFSPGDTGFMTFETRYATIGVAICWDQWFPEAARAMALQGAEVLLYPTAIGSEPGYPEIDSRDHWQRVMQGHSAANCIPVIASNRVGPEKGESCEVTFYGSSFITDHTGGMLAEADRESPTVITASLDLDRMRRERVAWGLFRDRRPDLYTGLLKLDGRA
jgi:N-carbamoylputrescine amidase